MRSLFFALVLGIMLSSACSGGKSRGILSEKKMTQLMTEVHLLDGYLSTLPIDSSRRIIDTLYTQLFARYGLDSTSFDENLTYYYSDPEKTEKIYDEIQKDLTGREKEIMRLDSIRSAIKQDSTNRANRYSNLLNMQRNLLRVYHKPDSMLNISEYNTQLYRASGLGHLWQRGTNQMPSRASTYRPPDPYAHIPELIRQHDEPLLDSLPAFEVYRQKLYHSIGLPRFWPDRSSVQEQSVTPESDARNEEEEVEEESVSDDNEIAP